MNSRRGALNQAIAAREVAHAVVYGANRPGTAIGWLTRWPVTREAVVVHSPGEGDLLLVNFYNHVPNAERIATDADVRWAGESAVQTAIEELRKRGAAGRRIGVIGPIDDRAHAALATTGTPVDERTGRVRGGGARVQQRPLPLADARRRLAG